MVSFPRQILILQRPGKLYYYHFKKTPPAIPAVIFGRGQHFPAGPLGCGACVCLENTRRMLSPQRSSGTCCTGGQHSCHRAAGSAFKNELQSAGTKLLKEGVGYLLVCRNRFVPKKKAKIPGNVFKKNI